MLQFIRKYVIRFKMICDIIEVLEATVNKKVCFDPDSGKKHYLIFLLHKFNYNMPRLKLILTYV